MSRNWLYRSTPRSAAPAWVAPSRRRTPPGIDQATLPAQGEGSAQWISMGKNGHPFLGWLNFKKREPFPTKRKKRAPVFWLVEFEGEQKPPPKKRRKTGHHWATEKGRGASAVEGKTTYRGSCNNNELAASKRARRQARRHASTQTSTQARKPASERARQRASKPTSKQSNKQANKHTHTHTETNNRQANRQASQRTRNQAAQPCSQISN